MGDAGWMAGWERERGAVECSAGVAGVASGFKHFSSHVVNQDRPDPLFCSFRSFPVSFLLVQAYETRSQSGHATALPSC